MGLAPLPHSLGVLGAAEVITVGGLAQPPALAGTLAGLAALRLGTVNLVMSFPVIGKKELLATTALATRELATHDGVPTEEEQPATESTTSSRKKEESEEGRRVLNEDREEHARGRKWNFKLPYTPYFHSAVHI